MNRDHKQDLQNLVKQAEFYALKKELLDMVAEMNDLSDIDTSKPSRLSIAEEVIGRQFAKDKIMKLLRKLGVLKKSDIKNIDQTYE